MYRRMIFVLVFIILSFSVFCFADDRVVVQVQFKKAIWTCPACGQEDIEDRPMGGGASYVHACSKCGNEFNQSGPNMKEYNGSINYTPEQYEKLKAEDLTAEKTKRLQIIPVVGQLGKR